MGSDQIRSNSKTSFRSTISGAFGRRLLTVIARSRPLFHKGQAVNLAIL